MNTIFELKQYLLQKNPVFDVFINPRSILLANIKLMSLDISAPKSENSKLWNHSAI